MNPLMLPVDEVTNLDVATKKGQIEYMNSLLGALMKTRIQLEADYRTATRVNLEGKATQESVGTTSTQKKAIDTTDMRISTLRSVIKDIEGGKLEL